MVKESPSDNAWGRDFKAEGKRELHTSIEWEQEMILKHIINNGHFPSTFLVVLVWGDTCMLHYEGVTQNCFGHKNSMLPACVLFLFLMIYFASFP